MTKTLGAIVYPGFELLDLYGPLEMFGCLEDRVQIKVIGETAGPIASAQAVSAFADFDFDGAPHLDLILLPGGIGTLTCLDNQKILNFLKQRAAKADITMSVCSGSAILARAGLLDGLKATSNKQFFDLARSQSNKVEWMTQARWVDAGAFVTSSGVSAGMDMALAVIQRLYGVEAAELVATMTEYQWHRDANLDPFAKHLNEAMKQPSAAKPNAPVKP